MSLDKVLTHETTSPIAGTWRTTDCLYPPARSPSRKKKSSKNYARTTAVKVYIDCILSTLLPVLSRLFVCFVRRKNQQPPILVLPSLRPWRLCPGSCFSSSGFVCSGLRVPMSGVYVGNEGRDAAMQQAKDDKLRSKQQMSMQAKHAVRKR